MNLTNKLRAETESARCHNIDAEDVMGMFSAAKNNAPNTTLNYLSSKIRTQKNGVVEYLESRAREEEQGGSDVKDHRKEATAGKQKEVYQLREELSQRIAP